MTTPISRPEAGIDQRARAHDVGHANGLAWRRSLGAVASASATCDCNAQRRIGDQPAGRPILSMMSSQASMHSAQVMHSSWLPSRMSMPIGQTTTQALQSMQSPASVPLGARFLCARARLAAPVLVGDEERVLVEHGALDARPGAHVGAHLLAHEAGEDEGGGGQDADGDVGDRRRLQREEVAQQRRRVGEVEDPGAAGRDRDDAARSQAAAALARSFERPGRLVEPHAGVAVALDEALDADEEIGPHCLRAGIAAPGPADDATSPGTAPSAGHDQQAGDVVELLRPDLDEEEVEAAVGEVDEHRLVRRVRAAVPAEPRRDLVDAEGDRHDEPLQVPAEAVRALRVDLDARL